MITIVIVLSIVFIFIGLAIYGTYELSVIKYEEDILGLRKNLVKANCFVTDDKELVRSIVKSLEQSEMYSKDGELKINQSLLESKLKEKGIYGILDKEALIKFCHLIQIIRETGE